MGLNEGEKKTHDCIIVGRKSGVSQLGKSAFSKNVTYKDISVSFFYLFFFHERIINSV